MKIREINIDTISKNLTLILSLISCLALWSRAQAVSPPPDGGYAGGNTAEGQNALFSLTGGGFNTAVGWFALTSNMTGNLNTAIGAGTLSINTGEGNTAVGAAALLSNGSGPSNTAVGATSLLNNTDGGGNVAVGFGALANVTSGHNNTAVGTTAGSGVTTAQGVTCLNAFGANVDNSTYIGGIFGKTVNPATGTAVVVDADHKLGTLVSSKRFKENIKPIEKASEAILALKPVMFHYKSDSEKTQCYGLIAEEVADVNPSLVVRDKNGDPLTVRYDQVNAMLLNEFLKDHRKVEEQGATIAQQQKEITALEAELKEQAWQIQKVTAKLELNKSAPQVAENKSVNKRCSAREILGNHR